MRFIFTLYVNGQPYCSSNRASTLRRFQKRFDAQGHQTYIVATIGD